MNQQKVVILNNQTKYIFAFSYRNIRDMINSVIKLRDSDWGRSNHTENSGYETSPPTTVVIYFFCNFDFLDFKIPQYGNTVCFYFWSFYKFVAILYKCLYILFFCRMNLSCMVLMGNQ